MALNPFSSSAPGAAQKKKALVKIGAEGSEQQAEAIKKGYKRGRADLAPTLTNVQQLYDQEEAQRKAYIGALGGGTDADRALAQSEYNNYLQPVDQYGIQDLFRYAGNTGTLASGGTQKDLYDYGYTTRFAPWLNAMSQFNPLGVNAQYGELAGRLAGLDVGQGTALSGIYDKEAANKMNAVGGYYDALAGANQNATQNLFNAGIAGVNLLGQGIGVAMNPAKALPQYAANTAPVNSAANKPFGWYTGV